MKPYPVLGEDYTLLCACCGMNEAQNEWLRSAHGWLCSQECKDTHIKRVTDFLLRTCRSVMEQDLLLAQPTRRPTLAQVQKERKIQRAEKTAKGRWKRHESVEARSSSLESSPQAPDASPPKVGGRSSPETAQNVLTIRR